LFILCVSASIVGCREKILGEKKDFAARLVDKEKQNIKIHFRMRHLRSHHFSDF